MLPSGFKNERAPHRRSVSGAFSSRHSAFSRAEAMVAECQALIAECQAASSRSPAFSPAGREPALSSVEGISRVAFSFLDSPPSANLPCYGLSLDPVALRLRLGHRKDRRLHLLRRPQRKRRLENLHRASRPALLRHPERLSVHA